MFLFPSDKDDAPEADVCDFEDVVYGPAESEVLEADDMGQAAEMVGPGIQHITTADQCQDVCNSTLCLVFLQQLKELAVVNVQKCTFPGCSSVPDIKEKLIGSAVYLRWVREFL